MLNKGDVVQFNERHKWCGALGIVDEIKPSCILVAIPHIHEDRVGTAYIRCNANDVEYVGLAVLVVGE